MKVDLLVNILIWAPVIAIIGAFLILRKKISPLRNEVKKESRSVIYNKSEISKLSLLVLKLTFLLLIVRSDSSHTYYLIYMGLFLVLIYYPKLSRGKND